MPVLNLNFKFFKKGVRASALASLLFISNSAFASPTKLKLPDLRSNGKQHIAQKNQASVVLAIQPDCPWCTKQGKDLKLLKDRCGDQLNLVILGARGSKKELKQELQHFSPELRALLSNSKLNKQVRGIKGTPSLLFFTADGTLVSKRRGYLKTDILMQAGSMLIEEQGGEAKACEV
ncbi:thioredoxin fold domain-containing protein [Agaribacterium sp. ZY112]|uniref:thioredoxin fold domain-containing protein n=1 Tax=Agaribacterium sp. ZY112 TaxID=3233574 RepID=UPI003524D524